MIRLSALMAIAVGALIGVAQIARNYDNWENWPTWMIDELAAAVLIVAGLLALRKRMTRLLLVAWSFACGLYMAGAVSHWKGMGGATGEMYVSESRLLLIVAALVVFCLVGLAMAFFSRKPAGQ